MTMGLHHLLPPGKTVKEAAEDLGIHRDYLSRILLQKVQPHWKLALEIEAMFPKIKRGMLLPGAWGED